MPSDIASNSAQRISELSARITSAQSRTPADGQDRLAIAQQAAQWNEEKSYQSGAGSFPNPFNPPGQSNRK
jgi:hypothetical protein